MDKPLFKKGRKFDFGSGVDYVVESFLGRSTYSEVYVVDTTYGVPARLLMKVNLPACMLPKFSRASSSYDAVKEEVGLRTSREAGYLKSLTHPNIASYVGMIPLELDAKEDNLHEPSSSNISRLNGIIMGYTSGCRILKYLVDSSGALYTRIERAVSRNNGGKNVPAHLFRTLKITIDNFMLIKKVFDEQLFPFFEEREIVHQDLKPENIVVAADKDGRITSLYVIDFGSAYRLGNHNTNAWGDRLYSPPARFMNPPVADPNRDKWSVGIMLAECISGNHVLLPGRIKGTDKTARKDRVTERMRQLVEQSQDMSYDKVFSESGIKIELEAITQTLLAFCSNSAVQLGNNQSETDSMKFSLSEITNLGSYMNKSFSFAALEVARKKSTILAP